MLGSPAQFFQLIKAGSALPDVGEQERELSVRGPLREFQQDIGPWTGDALRIGKVFMHYPVKRVEQLFFEVHAAMPQLNMESKPDCHVAVSRIPRSMIGVDENLCVHSPIVSNRCGRVSELGGEYDGDRAHLMSVLLTPDQAKNAE